MIEALRNDLALSSRRKHVLNNRSDRAPISTFSSSSSASLCACALGLIAGFAVPASAESNLTGTWQAVAPRASILSGSVTIPFTSEGKKIYDENRRDQAKKDFEFDRTTSDCSAPGVPRVMLTAKRFQIFQDGEIVMIGFEWNRFRRAISLPALPKQFSIFGDLENASLVGTKMGTSIGHWEGDTLVIVTTQFSDDTLIDEVVPHGYQLKVTERMRLLTDDVLEDRVMIEDPEYFTRPFETVLTYARQPDVILPEDNCLDRISGAPPLPTR